MANAFPILRLEQVSFVRQGRTILDRIDWEIPSPGEAREHWAVVGLNGAGKTTMLRLASAEEWPTSGRVTVLGERFGRTDLRELRRRIGWVTAAQAGAFCSTDTALDVVTSGIPATLGLTYYQATDAERDRARQCLKFFGLEDRAGQPFVTMSQGEKQKTLIARSLLPSPGLLILDEPCVGLDLHAREELLARVSQLADNPSGPAMILVTHHIEEIPPAFTHAAILKAGRMIRQGRTEEVFTSDSLSEAFALPVLVECRDGRFWARVRAV